MAWRNTCETWWDGSKEGWCVRTRFCPKPQHSGNCYRCDPSRDQDLLDEIRKAMVEVTAGEDWVQSWFEFAKTRQGNFVNNGKSASKPYGDKFDTGESELDESEKALKETAKHLQNLIKENVQIRKKLNSQAIPMKSFLESFEKGEVDLQEYEGDRDFNRMVSLALG